jgi:hypothetical protein
MVIVAFELVTGRAVSSYTGGSDPDRRTSIPFLGSGPDRDERDDDRDPAEDGTSDEVAPDDAGGAEDQEPAPRQEGTVVSSPSTSPTASATESATPSPLSEPTTSEATATPQPESSDTTP